MALPVPAIFYNNGSGNTNLAPYTQANVSANTQLTVGLQSTAAVVSVTFQIAGPGTIYWSAETTIQATSSPNLTWSFTLPATPTIYTLTTIVSDGNNVSTVQNTFLAEATISGNVPTGTGIFHITNGTGDSAALNGTANQYLQENSAGTNQSFVTLNGDVSPGASGAITVIGIQTIPVANTAPTSGQSLVYNGTNYVPASSPNGANLTVDAVLLGNGTSAITTVSGLGTSGQALISAGAATKPAWGTLGAAGGGTGAATLTAHAVLIGEGTSAVGFAGPDATSGVPLLSAGASTDPSFAALTLSNSSAVAGVLAVANGGTGDSTLTANAVLLGAGTSAVTTVSGLGTSGYVLTSQGAGLPPIWAVTGGGGGTVAVTGGGTGLTTLTAHAVMLGEGTSNVGFAGPSSTIGLPLISQGSSADPSFANLAVSGGGTSLTTLTAHAVLIGEGTNAVQFAGPNATSGVPLLSAGSSTNPSFTALTLSNTSAVTGTLAASNGGTGAATLTAHAVLVGEGTSAIGFVGPDATSGVPLLSAGSGSDPSFTALTLSNSSAVTGVLAVTNGGTGAASFLADGVLYGNGTSAIGVTPVGTTGYPLVSNGGSSPPAFALLGFAGGGTGSTSYTTNGVIYSNGSSFSSTSTGTTGQVLKSNGSSSNPSFQNAPTLQTAIYLSSTTFPAPITGLYIIESVGGGGGGGGGGAGASSSASSGGGGGGAPPKCFGIGFADAGDQIEIAIGAGGAGGGGGTSSGASGTNGSPGGGTATADNSTGIQWSFAPGGSGGMGGFSSLTGEGALGIPLASGGAPTTSNNGTYVYNEASVGALLVGNSAAGAGGNSGWGGTSSDAIGASYGSDNIFSMPSGNSIASGSSFGGAPGPNGVTATGTGGGGGGGGGGGAGYSASGAATGGAGGAGGAGAAVTGNNGIAGSAAPANSGAGGGGGGAGGSASTTQGQGAAGGAGGKGVVRISWVQ